jgi:predicted ester cyclase
MIRVLSLIATLSAASLLIAAPVMATEGCPSSSGRAALSTLLDRYVAAVNAHDTSLFPALFAEEYMQHLELWPDIQMQVEDRIIADDKIAARVTFTATHSRTVANVAPTGRKVSFGTMDIWRVECGKLAEHWDLVDTAGLQKQLRGE